MTYSDTRTLIKEAFSPFIIIIIIIINGKISKSTSKDQQLRSSSPSGADTSCSQHPLPLDPRGPISCFEPVSLTPFIKDPTRFGWLFYYFLAEGEQSLYPHRSNKLVVSEGAKSREFQKSPITIGRRERSHAGRIPQLRDFLKGRFHHHPSAF